MLVEETPWRLLVMGKDGRWLKLVPRFFPRHESRRFLVELDVLLQSLGYAREEDHTGEQVVWRAPRPN